MKFDLKKRLSILCVALTIIPLLSFTVSNQNISEKAEKGCEDAALSDMTHVVESAGAMCKAYQQAMQDESLLAIRTACRISDIHGKPRLMPDSAIAWKAINQETKAAIDANLPAMEIGDLKFVRNDDPAKPSSLVDEIRETTKTTCTVFQRMNEEGDMLRVATNVINKDGKRAVGTFIPVQGESGKNPVLEKTLKGEIYVGRAFVVDGWYSTAYSPMKDPSGKVVGMLYIGIPEADATSAIRQAISGIKIAKEGDVLILNTQGKNRGIFVLNSDKEKIGTSGLEETDASGNRYIEKICEVGSGLAPGKTQRIDITLGDPEKPRKQTYLATYFKPWDWLIAARADNQDINAAAIEIATMTSDSKRRMLIFAVIAALASAAIGVWFSTRISGKLNQIAVTLGRNSAQMTEASTLVSSSSDSVAQSASKQAASIEETTSMLSQVSDSVKKNADKSKAAADISNRANHWMTQGEGAMKGMLAAIAEIQQAAKETAAIVKTIDDIAFQTNLLALNAAVEAARAGDAGKGFAVVAQEVRNLAIRAADAARQTTALIETSLSRAAAGNENSNRMAQTLKELTGSISQINAMIAEIADASSEQAQGITQAETAVTTMAQDTQANAANAEESAGAAKQLTGQSHELQKASQSLFQIING